MMETIEIKQPPIVGENGPELLMLNPSFKQSKWKCYLFGTDQFAFQPNETCKIPNWFWRWTQYLVLGNRWVKER